MVGGVGARLGLLLERSRCALVEVYAWSARGGGGGKRVLGLRLVVGGVVGRLAGRSWQVGESAAVTGSGFVYIRSGVLLTCADVAECYLVSGSSAVARLPAKMGLEGALFIGKDDLRRAARCGQAGGTRCTSARRISLNCTRNLNRSHCLLSRVH